MKQKRCDKCGKFMGEKEPRFFRGTDLERWVCLRCVPSRVLDCEDGIDELMWEQLMERAR